MKKLLIIEDKLRFITFRNRQVRTPVILTVNESELKALYIRMKMAGINKWKVKAVTEKYNEDIDYDDDYTEEVIIEELEEKPNTILEKLIKNGVE